VTAESCTGGLVASLLTDVPGASDVVWGAFVTYQADAKRRILGVPAATLDRYGEVSRETALAMARGALRRLPRGRGYAVATTGNAGPTGEPVGQCWIAVAGPGRQVAVVELQLGKRGRIALKRAFAQRALALLELALGADASG
jgi:nicotinamide-nucleotide amidase